MSDDKNKNLPATRDDTPAGRRLVAIVDKKVSLQTVVEGTTRVAGSPFRAVARYWALAHGRLPDAPNRKSALAHLPKGSEGLLRRDGSIILARRGTGRARGSFAQMFDSKEREKAKEERYKVVTEMLAEAKREGLKLSDISLVDHKLGLLTLSRMDDLDGADFRRSTVDRVDFVRTNLRGASFWRAKLIGPCFEGADLRDADFTSASVDTEKGADFALADLRGAKFSHDFPFDKVRLQGANLEGVQIIGPRGEPIEGARLTYDGQLLYGDVNQDAKRLAAPDAPEAEAAAESDADADAAEPSLPILKFNDLKRNDGKDWEQTDLEGMTLSSQKEQKSIKDADLSGRSLQGARLTGVSFEGCDFSDVDLTKAGLSGVTFSKSNLRKADFTGSSNIAAHRIGSSRLMSRDINPAFVDCDLTGARLPLDWDYTSVNLRGSTVDGVVLVDAEGNPVHNASLVAGKGVVWAEGTRPDVVFEGRTVRGRDFSNTDLTGMPFEGGKLSSVTLSGADATGGQFGDASIEDSVLEGTKLAGAAFDGAKIYKTNLRNAKLAGSSFDGADVADNDMSGADLEGTSWNKAEVKRIKFVGANLKRADFTGVVDFWYSQKNGVFCDMSNADLTGARFRMDTDFKALVLDGAKLDGVVIVDMAGKAIPGAKLDADKKLVIDAKNPQLVEQGLDITGANEEFLSLEGLPLKGANLNLLTQRPFKLKGADLRGATLPDERLTDADFSETRLDGQRFCRGAKDTSFEHAVLKNAVFTSDQELHRVSFRHADLSDADFSRLKDFCWNRKGEDAKIDFRNTNLSGTRFRMDMDFDACDLRYANTKDALITDKSGRVIPGAVLQNDGKIKYDRSVDLGGKALVVAGYDLEWGPSLEGAPLKGADLSSFPSEGLKMAGADLRDAKMPEGALTAGDFRKAILDGWEVGEGKVENCSFRDASLKGVKFGHGVQIHTCDFRGADLSGADFSRMEDFWYTSGENPKFVRMEGANLTGARFRMDTDFGALTLQGATLDGVIITDMAGRDIPGATLGADGVVKYDPNADLGGKPLDLTGIRTDYAPLNDAPLQGADLSEFSMTDLKLRGANLSGALLPVVDQSSLDFTEAKLPGVKIGNYEIELNSYRRANLDGVVFEGTKIDRCDFRGASMKGADFSQCDDFWYSDQDRSQLQDADLTGSVWRVDLDLDGVNLAGAKLDQLVLKDRMGTTIPGAKLNARGQWEFASNVAAPEKPVSFEDARLGYIKLNGANIPGVSFNQGDAAGMVLANSTLTGADFGKTRLNGVDMRGAKLHKADFSRVAVDMDGAELNLEGADLTGATWPMHMKHAKINLKGAKLDGVVIVDRDGKPVSGASLTEAGVDHPDLHRPAEPANPEAGHRGEPWY
ncbi:MAG: hypothetical protein Alpg2KO_15950 [Alphaproteobacteria bacterium]